MLNEKEAYEDDQVSLWTKKGDELTTMGDFLGRLPAINIINPKPGEKILDAGCGAGFVGRRIAKLGGDVYGCDRSEKMLEAAKSIEKENPLNIQYDFANIDKYLPYDDNFFDSIICTGVLIHCTPEECLGFLKEARRVLRPEGKIVISTMHPDLYLENSANRTGKASWAQYKPQENKSLDESQKFTEDYYDRDGNLFQSTVWYHPLPLFPKLFEEAGLITVTEYHQYMTKDALEKAKQTGEVGYRSYYQILGVK